MEAIIAFFLTWGPLIAGVTAALLSVAGLIVAATPSKDDDRVFAVVRSVVNFVLRLLPGASGQIPEPSGPSPEPGLPGTETQAGGLPMRAPRDPERPSTRNL